MANPTTIKDDFATLVATTEEQSIKLFPGQTWSFELMGRNDDGTLNIENPVWFSRVSGTALDHAGGIGRYIAYPGDCYNPPLGTRKVFYITNGGTPVMNVVPGPNTLEPL